MNNKYIIKYLLIMLFCILLCGCTNKKEKQHEDQHIVLGKEDKVQDVSEEETGNINDEAALENEEIHDAAFLEYTEDIDESYINKCIFLGDSRMVGMSQAGYIKPVNTLAQIGLCHTNAMHTRYKTYAGMDYSFKSYLQSHQASVIYICYGINGITSIKEDNYKKAFKDIVNSVKEYEPDSAIVISSIWPVDDGGQYHATVSTELVKKYNEFLHELALEENVYYLDLCGQLSLEDGSIDPRFDRGDGLHYNKEGYQVVYDYILHHPVTNIKEDGLNNFSKETFIWENPVKPKEESASGNVSEENMDAGAQGSEAQEMQENQMEETYSEEQYNPEGENTDGQNIDENNEQTDYSGNQENAGDTQDDPENTQEQTDTEATVEEEPASQETPQQSDDGGIHEDFVL